MSFDIACARLRSRVAARWVRFDAALCAALVGLWAAASPLEAGAAVAEPAVLESASFQEAIARTLERNPQLLAAGYALDAARAREQSAAFAPALNVSTTLENAAGTGTFTGLNAADLTLALSSTYERGGKREARIGVARAELELTSVEQRITTFDVLTETARRYVALAASQSRLALSQRQVDQLDETRRLIEPRVNAARSPRTELLNVRLDLSRAVQRLSAAERAVEAARIALSAQWGGRDLVSARTDLLTLPPVADLRVLRSRLDTVPDLARFASSARVRESELRLATAQASTDWGWQVGVRRLGVERDTALMASVSMSLGQAARARPLQAEARAGRALVEAEGRAARNDLEGELGRRSADLASARDAVSAISSEQLPLAEEALSLTRRGYEIGRFPYRELSIAQQQILDLETARLDAAVFYHLTRVELERLTGGRLDVLE